MRFLLFLLLSLVVNLEGALLNAIIEGDIVQSEELIQKSTIRALNFQRILKAPLYYEHHYWYSPAFCDKEWAVKFLPIGKEEGYNALELAIDSGDLELVEQLLRRHADPHFPRKEFEQVGSYEDGNLISGSYNQATPLSLAIDKGNLQIINALVRATKDLTRPVHSRGEIYLNEWEFSQPAYNNKERKNAIQYAESKEIIAAILEGLSEDITRVEGEIFAEACKQGDLILVAIKEGNLEKLALFLSRGQTFSYRHLDAALKKGDNQLLQYLIENGFVTDDEVILRAGVR